MTLRTMLFGAIAALLLLLVYWQRPDGLLDASSNLESNVLLFALVNLIVVVILVLIFLIGRNVVKLIFDRRRRILGSKLRLKLVAAFVGLALVPTVILFVLASGLINKAMEGWFSSQIEGAVSGAMRVAREHFNVVKLSLERRSGFLKREVENATLSGQNLEKAIEQVRTANDLFSIKVVTETGEVLHHVENATAVIADFSEPELNLGSISDALKGEPQTLVEEYGAGQFIRNYQRFEFNGKTRVLVLSRRISSELSEALNEVNQSFKEYGQLKLFRNPIKSSYLLTLAMITGLILFSAIWIGFYLAREITGPLQKISEGTQAVAKGNYDFQIALPGDDEIGYLVRSFNRMIYDLKSSRSEGERRRLYIETILSNLAVAVIGLDTSRHVTSINNAASELFGVRNVSDFIEKKIDYLFKPEQIAEITLLLDQLDEQDQQVDGSSVLEKELPLVLNGRHSRILATVGKILTPAGKDLGTILIFDDITDLAKVQQLTAWREMARRIAHEIKNPLTPIQLAAQRLEKLIANNGAVEAINECTVTIVEHVGSMNRLVNEFSKFARMPAVEFQMADLNMLIADTVSLLAEKNPNVTFQFIADGKMPEVPIDREQIRRVLINLLDNAVGAVSQLGVGAEGGAENPGRVEVVSRYDRRRKAAVFEIADNGVGIKPTDRIRIFEPYFTTKSDGTGLGLAIVSSIVADHQGDIRVYDNQPHGAKFIVELPAAPRSHTQRRFAA